MRKRCHSCSTGSSLSRHHVLPKSLGGTISDGLLLMCRKCHDLVHHPRELKDIDDDRYRHLLSNPDVVDRIQALRDFIAQATEWYKQGVLYEMLGIDKKSPRNARRGRRYSV